jgi:DNA repair protein RecN (Recombination protein N)
MLARLVIQNYLLVRQLELDFAHGLTALTGETGAGKSMIVGALDVLLGERFPKDAVLKGAERAVIEGYFVPDHPSAIYHLVGDDDIEQSAEVLVRREISQSGRTRSMINDRPVTLDILQQARNMLADFHGQREHQSLFRAATQLEYLDSFAECRPLAAGARKLFERRSVQRRELERKTAELSAFRKDRALLEYQLDEIQKLGLKPNEEESIEARLSKLESAEKIAVEAARLLDLLAETEPSAITLAGRARFAASAIAKMDRDFTPMVNELSDLESRIKDLGFQIRQYADSLEFDPAELEDLRERRGLIWKLKRKHGLTIEEILKRADDLKTMVERGDVMEQELEQLRRQLAQLDVEFVHSAEELSVRRREAAMMFGQAVVAAMKPLGFAAPQFVVQVSSQPAPIDAAQLTADGADKVQFLFSANPGTNLAPIAAVASGGESSRVTLAIKSVLAKKISYPMMVYDEIDLGISGRVADHVGSALAGLAKNHQVLVITHLPQIASRADQHLLVTKSIDGDVTHTTAKFLSPAERVKAIAALIAGVHVTDKALASASELLRQSGKIANAT